MSGDSNTQGTGGAGTGTGSGGAGTGSGSGGAGSGSGRSASAALVRRMLWIRGINAAGATRIKGCFVVGRRNAAKFHLPTTTVAVWTDRGAKLVAETACGVRLYDVRPVLEAPDDVEGCDNCLLADFPIPVVYWLDAADGSVLYIGCSVELHRRLMAHRSTKFWPMVANIRWQQFETHAEALTFEAAAIREHQPPFNNKHTERARYSQRASAA